MSPSRVLLSPGPIETTENLIQKFNQHGNMVSPTPEIDMDADLPEVKIHADLGNQSPSFNHEYDVYENIETPVPHAKLNHY